MYHCYKLSASVLCLFENNEELRMPRQYWPDGHEQIKTVAEVSGTLVWWREFELPAEWVRVGCGFGECGRGWRERSRRLYEVLGGSRRWLGGAMCGVKGRGAGAGKGDKSTGLSACHGLRGT